MRIRVARFLRHAFESVDDNNQHMAFVVFFPGNPQRFDVYLFSWDKSKMAGTTVWQGRTFGTFAEKTNIGTFVGTNATVPPGGGCSRQCCREQNCKARRNHRAEISRWDGKDKKAKTVRLGYHLSGWSLSAG